MSVPIKLLWIRRNKFLVVVVFAVYHQGSLVNNKRCLSEPINSSWKIVMMSVDCLSVCKPLKKQALILVLVLFRGYVFLEFIWKIILVLEFVANQCCMLYILLECSFPENWWETSAKAQLLLNAWDNRQLCCGRNMSSGMNKKRDNISATTLHKSLKNSTILMENIPLLLLWYR